MPNSILGALGVSSESGVSSKEGSYKNDAKDTENGFSLNSFLAAAVVLV